MVQKGENLLLFNKCIFILVPINLKCNSTSFKIRTKLSVATSSALQDLGYWGITWALSSSANHWLTLFKYVINCGENRIKAGMERKHDYSPRLGTFEDYTSTVFSYLAMKRVIYIVWTEPFYRQSPTNSKYISLGSLCFNNGRWISTFSCNTVPTGSGEFSSCCCASVVFGD